MAHIPRVDEQVIAARGFLRRVESRIDDLRARSDLPEDATEALNLFQELSKALDTDLQLVEQKYRRSPLWAEPNLFLDLGTLDDDQRTVLDNYSNKVRLATRFAVEMAAYLRYVASSVQTSPAVELVAPLVEIGWRMYPNAKVIFRRQNRHNFEFMPLAAALKAKAEPEHLGNTRKVLERAFPPSTREQRRRARGGALRPEMEGSLDIISYPTLAEHDPLLLTALGHEVGHFLISKHERSLHLDKARLSGPRLGRNAVVAYHWVQELAADVVGTLLFGPAYLFALSQSFFSDPHCLALDSVPNLAEALDNEVLSVDSYPPQRWRYWATLWVLSPSDSLQRRVRLSGSDSALARHSSRKPTGAYFGRGLRRLDYFKALANPSEIRERASSSPESEFLVPMFETLREEKDNLVAWAIHLLRGHRVGSQSAVFDPELLVRQDVDVEVFSRLEKGVPIPDWIPPGLDESGEPTLSPESLQVNQIVNFGWLYLLSIAERYQEAGQALRDAELGRRSANPENLAKPEAVLRETEVLESLISYSIEVAVFQKTFAASRAEFGQGGAHD